MLRAEAGPWGVSVALYGGVERQLGQHWSFTTDLTPSLGFDRRPRRGAALHRLGAALGTRYYYSQARRQRKGKPVRALNGTYLQLQYRSEFNGYYGGDYYGTRWRMYYRHTPSLDAFWGYQRQLGRRGFCDLGAGVGLRRPDYFLSQSLDLIEGRNLALGAALRARVGVVF
ncbi:hypothetical protein GCM10027048_09960 [Hymenobacter coalescens]